LRCRTRINLSSRDKSDEVGQATGRKRPCTWCWCDDIMRSNLVHANVVTDSSFSIFLGGIPKAAVWWACSLSRMFGRGPYSHHLARVRLSAHILGRSISLAKTGPQKVAAISWTNSLNRQNNTFTFLYHNPITLGELLSRNPSHAGVGVWYSEGTGNGGWFTSLV
jgi:hypothetical protein